MATDSERLADQIAEYENAAHDYVQDGVRLLELAKKAYFLFKQQKSSEKRKLLNFVCSNSTWKDQTLTATLRQPFDLLALTNTTWQRKGHRNLFRRPLSCMAEPTGLEPATSDVTGRRSNQLNYDSACN